MSIEIITTENDFLRIDIAPALGGKIVSVFNKTLQKEFLWNNAGLPLASYAPGTEYDPHFWGGIDELIPNDLVENIDGIDYPDHGELWTTPLDYEKEGDRITVQGKLPLSELYYKKAVYLEAAAFISEYTIRNESGATRHFLWKLHAALAIGAGDQLITGAQKAKVIDPAWSRFTDTNEFNWPHIENTDASIVPPKSNAVDFFYLYNQQDAFMKLKSADGHSVFSYQYDKKIFPCQWFFASYGGFLDHYTAILEPCTNMPMAVNEAMQNGYCAVLQPGEELKTTVRIYAGKNDEA